MTVFVQERIAVMAKHSHEFVETFEGFVGFGLDRHTDEDAVRVYLQKFSDDRLMDAVLKKDERRRVGPSLRSHKRNAEEIPQRA